MSDRIFMGYEDNRAVMRVALPGEDAKRRSAPMVFSSDNDYLKVHMRGPAGGVIVPRRGGQGNERRIYGLYQSFPDLGYKPYVFFAICIDSEGGLNNRVIFPNDYSGATDRYPVSVRCAVANYGVWWRLDGYNFTQTFKVKFIVFKNKMAD